MTTVEIPTISVVYSPKSYPVTIENRTIVVVEKIQQGLMGPVGAASTLVINITIPTTVWTLSHQLNRFPDPVFVDASGDVVIPTWSYADSNTIIANFGNPTSGVAYIN